MDTFASLTLDADDDLDNDPEVLHEGVAHLASLLSPEHIVSEISDSPQDKSRKARKPNAQFANKIMYAELLEMNDDQMLIVDDHGTDIYSDGLPVDLNTNWVALAPVPRGKRCLAVSNQSSYVPGTGMRSINNIIGQLKHPCYIQSSKHVPKVAFEGAHDHDLSFAPPTCHGFRLYPR